MQKQLELTCAQCLGAFNLTNKVPRILQQCGHSLCQECIYFHIIKSKKSGFECPADQQYFIYSEQDIDQFVKNYQLIRQMQDKLKKKKQSLANGTAKSPTLRKSLMGRSKSRYDYSNEKKPLENRLSDASSMKTNKFDSVETKSASKHLKLKQSASQYENRSLCKNNAEKQTNNTLQKKIDEGIKNYNIENSFQMNLLSNHDNEFDLQFTSNHSTILQKHEEMRMSQENGKKQTSYKEQRCREHNKVCESICIDHLVHLCSTCVAVGKHKLHKIIPQQQAIQDITVQAESLIQLLQKHQKTGEVDFGMFSNLTTLIDQCASSEQKLVDSVKSIYKQMRQTLLAKEQETLADLQSRFELIAQKLVVVKSMDVESLQAQKKKWSATTQDLIKQFIQITSENQIPLGLLEQQKSLHAQGVILYNDTEKLKKTNYPKIKTQLDSLQVRNNQQLLSQLVVVLPEDQKQAHVMTQHQRPGSLDQNTLLNFHFEQESQPSLAAPEKRRTDKVLTSSYSSKYLKRPKAEDDNQSVKTTFSQLIQKYSTANKKQVVSSDQELCKSVDFNKTRSGSVQGIDLKRKAQHTSVKKANLNVSENILVEDQNNRRRKVSLGPKRVPERVLGGDSQCSFDNGNVSLLTTQARRPLDKKHQQILQDLKNDTVEVLNLTCSNLENAGILVFLPLIESSKRLRQVKMVQNGLTDASAEIIFRTVQKNKYIKHLNLSMNKFTEASLVTFQQVYTKAAHITNLFMMQNRLPLNKMFRYKKELKKLGVTLYT